MRPAAYISVVLTPCKLSSVCWFRRGETGRTGNARVAVAVAVVLQQDRKRDVFQMSNVLCIHVRYKQCVFV